jgi:hypothetical protein
VFSPTVSFSVAGPIVAPLTIIVYPKVALLFLFLIIISMHRQSILAVLAASAAVSALPLNINLGAYSPALVVGDGEISFGGSPQEASQVLQTLASGAQNGAVAAGTAPRGSGTTTINPPPGPPQSAGTVTGAISAPPQGPGAPVSVAEAAAQPADHTVSGPGEYISHMIGNGFDPTVKYPNMVKRSNIVPEEGDAAKEHIKRDLEGFREALNFARDAMKNTPRIDIGSEDAGVGIIVNAGENVPVNSAANGARPQGQRRRLARRSEPQDDKKLGMTLIAIGEI